MEQLPPPEHQDLLPRPQPIGALSSGLTVKKGVLSGKKKPFIIGGIIIAVLIGVTFIASIVWYKLQLRPVDSANTQLIPLQIESGTTPAAIGTLLESEGLIRSAAAFDIYTRIEGVRDTLQAGSYRLSPSDSTQEVVGHITNGQVDTFDITFLPGATLAENRSVLANAGYSDAEIDAGFSKEYTGYAVLKDKPADRDLEGYIFGETYRMSSSATVEDIIEYTFEIFDAVVEENDLERQFAQNGLNLFEGITLASIIQRESIGGDEAQIAQVFYNRIDKGMVLGSDVTYQYIADKLGVERSTTLYNPYNTRRFAGLPPGPIASPGVASLQAVATPAVGDFIYFLSGDDDITYFARTLQEHEANIIEHCQVKCSII